MNVKFNAVSIALVAMALLAVPSAVSADNGKGSTKPASPVVVKPGSTSPNVNQYYSPGRSVSLPQIYGIKPQSNTSSTQPGMCIAPGLASGSSAISTSKPKSIDFRANEPAVSKAIDKVGTGYLNAVMKVMRYKP